MLADGEVTLLEETKDTVISPFDEVITMVDHTIVDELRDVAVGKGGSKKRVAFDDVEQAAKKVKGDSDSQPATTNTQKFTIISSEATQAEPLANAHSSSLKTNDFYESQTIDYAEAKNVSVPKWDIMNDFRMDDAWVCRNFNDHLSSPEKKEKKILQKEEEVQRKYDEIVDLRLRLERAGGDFVEAMRLRGLKTVPNVRMKELTILGSRNAKLSGKMSDAKGKRFDERATELDDRLSALDVEFDIKLFANVKGQSIEYQSKLEACISLAIDEEQCLGLEVGVVHGKAGRNSKDIEAYCAEAKDKYEATVKDLENIPFPLLESLEAFVGTYQPSSLASENEVLVVIGVASLRFAALEAETIVPAIIIDSTSLTLEGSAPMVVVSQEQPLPSLTIKS
ncbi:hypothetical protein Tco_0633507 [Tanacetum coccineum]